MAQMKGLGSSGIWRVRVRGTDDTLANIRLEYAEGESGKEELRVFIQENGEGSWKEDPVAFGLLLGDYGAVEQIA